MWRRYIEKSTVFIDTKPDIRETVFHLCEEHLKSKVCFLSPSKYIYKIQLENWVAAGRKKLENIIFFTCVRLLLMKSEEILQIQPDFIVLDKFHWCGAKMWEQGVMNLLATYS